MEGQLVENRFKQRCELVKRSCLSNSVNLSGWRMRRETQAHSDDEKPLKVQRNKQIIQERAKIPQSKRGDGVKTARREEPTMELTKETVSGP